MEQLCDMTRKELIGMEFIGPMRAKHIIDSLAKHGLKLKDARKMT